MLCPWSNGPLRPTSDHRWVHLLCAHLIPETADTFSPADPENLVDVFTINPERFKLKCVLCRVDYGNGGGAPVQCASKCCSVPMHALCARKAGWPVSFSDQKVLCGRHQDQASQQTNNEEPETNNEDPGTKQLKIRLPLQGEGGASSPTCSSGKFPLISIDPVPPLHVPRSTTAAHHKFRMKCIAPAVLIDRIVGGIELPGDLNQKKFIVEKIAKYWSLKREARRGTPLLKSLQLEVKQKQKGNTKFTFYL